MGNNVKQSKKKKRLARRVKGYEDTQKMKPRFDVHKPGSNNK